MGSRGSPTVAWGRRQQGFKGVARHQELKGGLSTALLSRPTILQTKVIAGDFRLTHSPLDKSRFGASPREGQRPILLML